MISYWKFFRNLSSLLRNLTYLSLLNSFLFSSRFSVSLKSLDNNFFRWFAYKSFLSRFSALISYNMWFSNLFSISSRFPCFSGSRFSGSGYKVQGLGPDFRSSPGKACNKSRTRLLPDSLPWLNRLFLLTFLKLPIIYGFIDVNNSNKFFLQAVLLWIAENSEHCCL